MGRRAQQVRRPASSCHWGREFGRSIRYVTLIVYVKPRLHIPKAIQLLKLSGFSPIITTASKHNEAYCKAAGATHIIDYHDVPYPELPAAVKKITSEPISVIYDAVALPDVQKALWEILAPNGKLASVAPPSFGKDGETNEDGKLVAGIYGSAKGPYNYEFGKKMYAAITELLGSGDIQVNETSIQKTVILTNLLVHSRITPRSFRED